MDRRGRLSLEIAERKGQPVLVANPEVLPWSDGGRTAVPIFQISPKFDFEIVRYIVT
jgi:hypothetical protein